VASRIGKDELGKAVRESLLSRGVTDQFLQNRSGAATGTVKVEIDSSGQPNSRLFTPWHGFLGMD